jgi:carbon-monoxide dehydrogenase medium subunit
MQSFEYRRPTSLSDAVSALGADEDAKLLAGGLSLVPAMKHDLAAPSTLVSLRDVAELRGILRSSDGLTLAALTTHAQVAGSPDVRGTIPALASMAERIGDPQVRNRGTLGGSIAHNDPAADYPAALVGLNAVVVTDRREIGADDFFLGIFTTALEADEVITSVRFPIPDRAAYSKFASPASKYAIVGVMVSQTGETVRVAVTGAGNGVFRVPAMEEALASDFSPDALDSVTVGAEDLVSDLEASAEYRAHLIGVLARRAVESCL